MINTQSNKLQKDFLTMSAEDLQKEFAEAEKNKDQDLQAKIVKELQKRLANYASNSPENKKSEAQEGQSHKIETLDDIKELMKKKALKKEDKEKILDFLEKDIQQKTSLQNASRTSNNQVVWDLIKKLNAMDQNITSVDTTKKIEKIKTAALPWIPVPTFNSTSKAQDGVTTKEISLGIKQVNWTAWKRHHRLNRVVNKLNDMWDDSAKVLKYITSMTHFVEWWRPTARLKRWFRSWLENKDMLRNPAVFKQKVEEQKQKFIENITQWITRPEELGTINAIKQRIDYFSQKYYLDQAKIRLS